LPQDQHLSVKQITSLRTSQLMMSQSWFEFCKIYKPWQPSSWHWGSHFEWGPRIHRDPQVGSHRGGRHILRSRTWSLWSWGQ